MPGETGGKQVQLVENLVLLLLFTDDCEENYKNGSIVVSKLWQNGRVAVVLEMICARFFEQTVVSYPRTESHLVVIVHHVSIVFDNFPQPLQIH